MTSRDSWQRPIAILLAIASLALQSCTDPPHPSYEGTLAKLRRTKELHVGYVIYPPTVMKDPNTGELSGHFVDAIRFIASTIDATLIFHESQFSTFTAALDSRQVDVSIAATYRTIPRALSVAFTNPIFFIGNGAIVRINDNRFRSLADLNQDVTIAVALGEASHEYAKQHFPRAKLNVLRTSTLALPLTEVLSGRADVGLADSWSTAQFARNNPDAKDLFATTPYDVTSIGWAVRTNDLEWLQFLNTALDYCKSTGRMEQWERQHDAHWLKPATTFLPN